MLQYYYKLADKISLSKNIFRLLTVVTLLLMLLLRYFDGSLHNQVSPAGIVSYELAKDIAETVKILKSWDSHAKISAAFSLAFDYFFLIFYPLFIATIIVYLKKSLSSLRMQKLAEIFVYLQFFTMIFDFFENYFLIRLLLSVTEDVYSQLAFYFAALKFLLLLCSLLYIFTTYISIKVSKFNKK